MEEIQLYHISFGFYDEIFKLIFISLYLLYLQVEPAVGAALLAWNAVASELDGSPRTVA